MHNWGACHSWKISANCGCWSNSSRNIWGNKMLHIKSLEKHFLQVRSSSVQWLNFILMKLQMLQSKQILTTLYCLVPSVQLLKYNFYVNLVSWWPCSFSLSFLCSLKYKHTQTASGCLYMITSRITLQRHEPLLSYRDSNNGKPHCSATLSVEYCLDFTVSIILNLVLF